MKAVKALFVAHLAALCFGLAGLLIALPHPELWSGSPLAGRVFAFGIQYAGSLHILFGAATVLLFGLLVVGWRQTLIFFVAATSISLSMELLGTGTGLPFGAYSYTTFLGAKVAGRVPFSIPLSWFYMGFSSYLLASAIVAGLGWRRRTLLSLVGGAYLLTVWDLALDPAMASQSLPIHFWIWHQTGPYFGMPLRNLAGWTLTGVLFMSVSRVVWRRNLTLPPRSVWLPLGVYLANCAFAAVLSLGAGLWLPVAMVVVLAVAPVLLLLRRAGSGSTGGADGVATRITQQVMRQGARALLGNARVTVEGLEHLPANGPVLIAARHYHHLDDGCVLLATLPRSVHILVALDWVRTRWLRALMEVACRMARWPVVLREERLSAPDVQSAYAAPEVGHYTRRGIRQAVELLRAGEALVVFPEAYPNVDPSFTPKASADGFLPFRPGFLRIAQLAGRHSAPIPIVPAGFAYSGDRAAAPWRITLRLGEPLFASDACDAQTFIQLVEQRVKALSGLARTAPNPAPEVATR
jgi:uncharacterized membrane protein/1-acyl-sn-glycerol-3-phosphate acyltransferase